MIAVEAAEIYPWFAGAKSGGTLTITSSQAYYGYWATTAQGSYFETSRNIRSGTYRFSRIGRTDSAAGIATITNRGVTVGTLDGYQAVGAFGAIAAVAGLLLRNGALRLTWSTKNGSSSGYSSYTTMARLVRTGA